jgi:hypothetical protein
MVMRRIALICLGFLCVVPAAVAQEATEPATPVQTKPTDQPGGGEQTPADDTAQVDELRRRLEILAAEVEQLRSGEPEQIEITEERRRALGLAPSAAATYRRRGQGVSFAGYGEMLLENFADENEAGARNAPTTRLDFLRAILYAGYRFNDKFLFNSEIEVEHGNEIFVEFAYVDYLANDNLTLRGGLLLLPLGLVNEFHEPNVFLGAKRPETEQRIIPTTLRENGGGVLGTIGPVNVRAYVTNGFNGAGFTSAGLRGGRQRGVQARAANLAFSGRVDVTPIPGIFAGVGYYNGGAGQEQVVLNGERLDIGTTIAEVHAQAQVRGFDVRGLFARASVDEAGAASQALRLPLTAPIADEMEGGYLQVGYNVLSQLNTSMALTPYVRYEAIDTQKEIPVGFTRDASRDGDFRTFGIDFKPIPNVVLKTEYQWITNAANTGRNQFNINLGYAF